MPVRRSEFSYIDSHMKSLSSIITNARVFRVGFFHTALCVSITVALLAAPTFTYAQNSHKPTAKHFKARVDESGPPQAEPGVQPSNEAIQPTSGPAISPFSITAAFLVTTPSWTALGPAPIPNGQTIPADANGISLTQAPVSGRLTAVAIDPADPNTAYVGAAQGGVYQTRDGGATWTPLMDNTAIAQTLAVGSLELDPTDATGNTLLVGSGESNFSADSYAGFGVYKLTNLKTSPVLSGPFNQSTTATDVFSKRSLSGLAIDPNHHDTVYVGSSTGQQGIGPQAFVGAPARGVFRSTNFFSGASTFTKLAVANLPAGFDFRVTSIVYEPGSSDHLFVGVADAAAQGIGGIYFTTNASAGTPVFTKVLATAIADFAPVKLAINKIGDTVTVVAATGETAPSNQGQGKAYKAVYKSSKPKNVNFTGLPSANGFAAGQGFYNLGVAIDPTNSNNIYVVGTLNGTFLFSRNGGGTFTPSNDTLHVDSHMVGVAPSNPSVIYTGNDGGVWRSNDMGLHWIDRNTATFSATQFQSVAVHPTDPNFSIGGTQDNGTNFFQPNRTWTRVDFGDGGYALIDQTATDTENVTMYHTYFNATNNLIGFGRVLKTSCAIEGQWSFKGAYTPPVDPTVHCDGTTDTFNGILLSDPVNFYAPVALGPVVTGGSGQTVYFGTNKLYRSINKGDLMTIVSQAFTSNVSAIGISKTNDDVRIVGLNSGKVFATITGGNPMTDVTQTGMPAKYLARAVIDPNDPNTAYVVYNGNGSTPTFKHIFKAANLNLTGTGTVTWTETDTGIPDVSVNAFVVDPADSTHLYAGTDRGVFNSTDGGSSWSLYGIGLPDAAVFDLAISSDGHLRAATHGRGFYEIVKAP
jgi:photosystem II stability/assembly factor-like uncharacterized protein